MPDPTPNMLALFARAESVLGSPVASLAGGLAEALDEVERLRERLTITQQSDRVMARMRERAERERDEALTNG